MAPKDDAENWRTFVRFRNWFKSQPLLIGVMAYALGGGSSTLMDKFVPQKVDPRLDTVMVAVREFRVTTGQIKPLQDTVQNHGERITVLEEKDARLAYSPPKIVGQGRRREKW